MKLAIPIVSLGCAIGAIGGTKLADLTFAPIPSSSVPASAALLGLTPHVYQCVWPDPWGCKAYDTSKHCYVHFRFGDLIGGGDHMAPSRLPSGALAGWDCIDCP